MWRFSIQTLMVVIFVSALGLVALKSVHQWRLALVPLMVGIALEVAVLSAMFLRGPCRAWLVGFCLSTVGYLLLTLDPYLSANLATTYVLTYVYAKLVPGDLEQDSSYYQDRGLPLPVDNRWRPFFGETVTLEPIQRVGHSLFALLAGLVGGMVAVWYYARRKREETAAG